MLQKPGNQAQVERTVAGVRVGRAGLCIIVGVAYFLAAQLGLLLLTSVERVAVFWPASGISAGILIALGPWSRAPVAVGVIAATLVANLASDRNVWSAFAFGLCNAGEAMLVAWLIGRWFGPPFNLDSLRRVLGFFAAAAVATATAAAGASGAMKLFGPSRAAFFDIWEVWFASDALGIMTVAPLLIGIADAVRNAPSRRELLEGTIAVAIVTAAITCLLGIVSGSWSLIEPSALLLPLLLWLGYRGRPAFAAAAVFTIAAAIVCTTTYEFGRYGDPTQPIVVRVNAARITLLGTTLAALALAALFAERRRHEATIVRSETRLRSILDAANVIAWDIDLVGNTVRSAGPVERFLAPPDRMRCGGLGAIAAAIHREDRNRVLAEFRAAVDAATEYRLDFRLASSGGGVRWITAEGAVQRDESGRALSMLGISRDITARKQAEERLQVSERKLRELLGALPAAIYVTDASGHITYCNRRAVDLWGIEPTLGKDKWSDLGRFYHPDGSPMALADCPTELALKQGRTVRGGEAIIERKDGARVPIAPYPISLRDDSGAIVGVVNMTVDVSERKRAELALAERNLQLALAGKAALVGSYAYDFGVDTMQVDEGYAALHGLPEGTTCTRRSDWESRVHPQDLGRLEAVRSQAFGCRRSEYAVEYRVLRSTGEVRWIESRSFISYSGEGHPQRVVGVNIDITERQRADEHLRMLLAELDHRVKNVLATVSALTSRTEYAGGSVADFVAALDGRIRSMAATHQLLSSQQWKGILLSDLVRRELAPYAIRGNVEIEGPDMILRAEAAQAVSMVLHELTTNAAKYGALSTPEGRVSVRWRPLQNGGADARLCIEWQEAGGPAVQAPRRCGYGMEVIRGLLPYELEGKVDLAFPAEGVWCRFDIPVAELLRDRLADALNGAGSAPTIRRSERLVT